MLFRGRRAVQIENEFLRITLLVEGGHIAEVYEKSAGISPLWIPHWSSVEPSSYKPSMKTQFGSGSDAKLLAGIMGHNVCLDIFGSPSVEEAAAGLTVHGEASILPYSIVQNEEELRFELRLPLAQLEFTRRIKLSGRNIKVRETVKNLTYFDRPIAWTQHVTLSPPFLDPLTTMFSASMTKSFVSETDPGLDGYLKPGALFLWPNAPLLHGGMADLTQMRKKRPASSYTALLADPAAQNAYFLAHSPQFGLTFGYVWRRVDFPWMGIWEENCSRKASPWNGMTVTRGMEFGVSPVPENRREMVLRPSLFEAPMYRWLGAASSAEVEYWICTSLGTTAPEVLEWPEDPS